MASVNKVILVGNCGRDPEIRYLPSGQAVANVSVATSSRRKDRTSGEMIEDTQWHRVTFYDRLAEIAGEYVKKGRPVYVEGRLKLETWDDKQTGQKRSKMRVVCEVMQMLGGRDGASGGAPSESSYGAEYEDGGRPLQRPPSRPSARAQAPSDPDLDPTGDEIPF